MKNAPDRVRHQVEEWLKRTHMPLEALSVRVDPGRHKSWFGKFLRGKGKKGGQDLGLRYLDPLARAMECTPDSLVEYDVAAVLATAPSAPKEDPRQMKQEQILMLLYRQLDRRRRSRLLQVAADLNADQEGDKRGVIDRKRRGSA